MASGPITSWQIDGETMERVTDFIFVGSKITAEVTEAMKLKDACSLEEKQCNRHCISVLNLDSVLKSRDFAYKSLSSQSYGFSSGHVWM